jgi:hypothetical protein
VGKRKDLTATAGKNTICIASHRIASHRIASHRIASHRIASHRIASHRIASLRRSALICGLLFDNNKYNKWLKTIERMYEVSV